MVSGSLALLADAGHMVTDAGALSLALLAIWVAGRAASIKRTFGFQRVEVLAALVNALGLWLIVTWILIEAYQRFLDPPEVQAPVVLVVGAGGLVINLLIALVLRRSAGDSLNIQGALVHVMGDLLGSVAVVAGGVLILAFGWFLVDPIFSVVIALLIPASSGRLLWKVSHVLNGGNARASGPAPFMLAAGTGGRGDGSTRYPRLVHNHRIRGFQRPCNPRFPSFRRGQPEPGADFTAATGDSSPGIWDFSRDNSVGGVSGPMPGRPPYRTSPRANE